MNFEPPESHPESSRSFNSRLQFMQFFSPEVELWQNSSVALNVVDTALSQGTAIGKGHETRVICYNIKNKSDKEDDTVKVVALTEVPGIPITPSD